MPTPKLGESLNEFIARCIPIVLEDGAAEDNQQAVAVCSSMYEDADSKQLEDAELFDYTYNGVKVRATRRRSSTRDDKAWMRRVVRGDTSRLVHYADPDMPMRRNNEEARADFNSRHSCSEKSDPFMAGFWACYDWNHPAEKREGAHMKNKQHEYKTVAFKVTSLDFDGRTLEGYAAVFGNIDQGGDIIHRGAFAKTLAERGNKVKFLWQHDWHEPIGRPLEMREDERGLYIKAIISDTERGRDALALLRDDAIDGMSIGYDAIPGGTDMSKETDGQTVRNLRELRLWEFSLVTFPMNESATVTGLKQDGDTAPEPAEAKVGRAISKANEARLMRAIEAAHNAISMIEEILDSAGLTDDDEDNAPSEDEGRDTEEMGNDKAGPPHEAPTSKHDHLELKRQQLLTQIQMMEVEQNE